MVDLDDYLAFVAIAEKGSLTAAAKHLGRSLQAVSRSLAALEADLGQTLVQRTTRASHPTEQGVSFLTRIKPALADLLSAHEEIETADGRVAGLLTVSAAGMFGIAYVGKAAVTFMDRYPDIDIGVDITDEVVDLVGDGVDLAVRLGVLPDSGLMARNIGTLRQVAFASPAYLDRCGRPCEPSHLGRHRCIVRTVSRHPQTWSFQREGRTYAVKVEGHFRSNSSAVCNEAALDGTGIAVAPLWQIRADIEAGRAMIVMPDYSIADMPVHVVWAKRQYLPHRTRLFIDHLAAMIPTSRL